MFFCFTYIYYQKDLKLRIYYFPLLIYKFVDFHFLWMRIFLMLCLVKHNIKIGYSSIKRLEKKYDWSFYLAFSNALNLFSVKRNDANKKTSSLFWKQCATEIV